MKETLVKLLRAQPFRPFEIRMSNGDAYQVRHPEMAFLLKSNFILGTPESDDFVFCAIALIADVVSVDLNPSS